MTKKTSKDNPIKRITLDSNVASAIVTQIAIALNVKLHTDKDEDGNILGVSAYIGNCIRLADHKTYLQTWVDNAMWDAPYRISIVIEDEETIGKTQVKEGYDFEVLEYIFKSQMMTPQKAREIAFDIKQARETGRFANNGGGEKFILKSVYNTLNKVQQNISMNCTDDAVPANRHNHGADFVSESKNNKTNKNESKNMNKKNTIRLTESDLKRVISESVKKILKEDEELKATGYWDKRTTYSPQHYCALRDKVGAINICDMMFRILGGEMLQMLYKAYPGLRWQLSEDDIEDAYVYIGPDKD